MYVLFHTKRSVFLQFIGHDTLIWNPNKQVAKKFHTIKDALKEIHDLDLTNVKPVAVETIPVQQTH